METTVCETTAMPLYKVKLPMFIKLLRICENYGIELDEYFELI